ncbi:MAG: AmmeMemoRadiSam system protein A [Mariprofundaceae bacterium]
MKAREESLNEDGLTERADKGHILTMLARSAISEALGRSLDGDAPLQEDWLQQKGACFVSLKKNGELRGCIGSLEACRPLLQDVHANAVNAALHDPRFPPLTLAELDEVRIEVSLLSPTRRLEFASEAEALSQLTPGRDGVAFEYGHHKSTFLPQVWEQLPDPTVFMAHLKIKAGLAADFWHEDVLIYKYSVEKYSEGDGNTAQEL